MTMHLLLETLGIISVNLYTDLDNLELMKIETYFNFLDGETTSINKVG